MRRNRTRQWNVRWPAIRAWGRLPLPNIRSMGGEFGPQGRRHGGSRAPSVDRSSFGCAQTTEDGFSGHKMHIDLDSWEAGYAHGSRDVRPDARLGSTKCHI